MLKTAPLVITPALTGPLQCAFDDDGDGIDDSVEQAIVEAFSPEFRFSAGEYDGPELYPTDPTVDYAHPVPLIGKTAAEPVLIYAAERLLGVSPIRLEFHLVAVFTRDGGFPVVSVDLVPDDSHLGDTQPLTLTVDLDGTWGSAWKATLVAISPGTDECAGAACATPSDIQRNGTHPIVYASMGKHHLALETYK